MAAHFFKRGSGPLVSVLIPSRGRPEHLYEAIASCHGQAADKSLIEFIVRADDDDEETVLMLNRLKFAGLYNLTIIVGPRGNGYYDMHKWVVEMARRATGDWLMFFNDDARIAVAETGHWDQTLLFTAYNNPWFGIQDVCCLTAPTVGRPYTNEFLIFRRKVFELLGYLGDSPHADNWVHRVCDFVGAARTVNILVSHDSGIINDKTRKESEAAYKTSIYTLTSLEARDKQLLDAYYLLDHMKRDAFNRKWTTTPFVGWNYWRRGLELKTVAVYEDGKAVYFNEKGGGEQLEWTEQGGEWSSL